MKRLHYNALHGVNEAIEDYDDGGIAIELSIKVNNIKLLCAIQIVYSTQQWMCGGMILTIPCSRVGYVYILQSASLTPHMLTNRIVIAESLMDGYKKHFYSKYFPTNRNAVVKKFRASINSSLSLRQRLKCNSFQWYMQKVYYDKKEPLEDSQYAGLVCDTYCKLWSLWSLVRC